MADQTGEKTEQPTQRKLEEAIKKGQGIAKFHLSHFASGSGIQ